MGFSHLCVGPIFAPAPSGDIFLIDDYEATNPAIQNAAQADQTAQDVARLCGEHGLRAILDIVLDRVAAEGAMARSAPHWFYRGAETSVVDPRQTLLGAEALPANFDNPDREHELTAWWIDRLVRLGQAGVSGFRLLGLADVPARFLKAVIAGVRQECGTCQFFGWTPGVSWSCLAALEPAGFDAVFASTHWWDRRATWFVDEHNALRRIASQIIATAEAPFEERLAVHIAQDEGSIREAYRLALRTAAATAQGLLVPIGFEFASRRKMDARAALPEDFERDRGNSRIDLTEDIQAANRLAQTLAAMNATGDMRTLSSPADRITALLQADAADLRDAGRGKLILINTGDELEAAPPLEPLSPAAGAAFGDPEPIEDVDLSATTGST